MNYGMVDAGNHKVVAISIWETREQAQKSDHVATNWVKENIADRVRLVTTYIGELALFRGVPRLLTSPLSQAALRGRSAQPSAPRSQPPEPPRHLAEAGFWLHRSDTRGRWRSSSAVGQAKLPEVGRFDRHPPRTHREHAVASVSSNRGPPGGQPSLAQRAPRAAGRRAPRSPRPAGQPARDGDAQPPAGRRGDSVRATTPPPGRQTDASVLDVGTGSGDFVRRLLARATRARAGGRPAPRDPGRRAA